MQLSAMPLEDGPLECLFNAMSLTSFNVGDEFYALATFIETPHNFYVAPIPFLRNIEILYKTQDLCRIENLHRNKIVIYESIALRSKVRGSIESVQEKMCKILAIDYGIMEDSIELYRIFEPALKEAVSTPTQVQHCELDKCIPRGEQFDKYANESFKKFMGRIRGEKLKVIVKGKRNNKLIVTIYNSCVDELSILMAFSGNSYMYDTDIYKKPEKGRMVVQKFKYKHQQITIDQTIEARVQSGNKPDSYYVIPVSIYPEYLETRRRFNVYCTDAPTTSKNSCVVGALVGAEIDGIYERAVIVKVYTLTNTVDVQLVDVGTSILYPINKLKAIIVDEFRNIPVFCLYCTSPQHNEPNNKTNNKGLYLIKGNIIKIAVQAIGLGFQIPHSVDIVSNE